ncbi:MAG: hydroxymethylbilane synthase [Hyphomicrobiales bacterium]|nr:hydroxymethylbilane synthase [Hyphomicrobiales bacterium]
MSTSLLRIGTRGSPLALVQAEDVRARIAAAHDLDIAAIEIVVIRTSGDRIQDRPLSEVGGKGLFTKEIEEALIEGRIDIAVHSMKDVATRLPDGLEIAAMLQRADVRDAFLSGVAASLRDLPQGAIVGTSSLRRQAQVLRARPDLKVIGFRGNVETRLKKLADGVAHATLLAMAGLGRLGMAGRATSAVAVEDMLPAVAQGAVGIEVRSSNTRAMDLVAPLKHSTTELCVTAERAFLARLDGSCRTPIAGLATLIAGRVHFRGEILTPDGVHAHASERIVGAPDAVPAAEDAAAELLGRAEPDFFAPGRFS